MLKQPVFQIIRLTSGRFWLLIVTVKSLAVVSEYSFGSAALNLFVNIQTGVNPRGCVGLCPTYPPGRAQV
jgi:hypothetical protein